MSLDMFEETDVPVTAGRPTKWENPFPPAIAHLLSLKDKGVRKALNFDLSHLIDKDDEENETLKVVTDRARRLLTSATKDVSTDAKPVRAQMSPVKDAKGNDTWKVSIFLVNSKPKTDVPPVETAAAK